MKKKSKINKSGGGEIINKAVMKNQKES